MSHFSTVKTMIKDKDILIKSLEDLNVVVSESKQYVKDYNGNEVLVDVCIEQENDNNIGFVLNDDSYELDESPKSLVDEDTFYGLCIDEDNQDELTEERAEKWVQQLKKEFNVSE